MRTLIKNVRIIERSITRGSVLLEGKKILGILPPSPEIEAELVIDGQGQYLSSGLIELHTHGSGGHDYMDGTQDAYQGAAETQLKHGVTTLLPTTVAASREEYRRTLNAFQTAREARSERQCLYGMHFEGPFFPVQRAGGMDLRYICAPDPSLYEDLIEFAPGCIARWTAAPEMDGIPRFGDFCIKHGILASIGHTDATQAVHYSR